MVAISDDAIRERAYLIWEREGRPHGRDFEHWVRARVELIAEESNHSSAPAAAASAQVRPRGRSNGGAAQPKRVASPKPRRSSAPRKAK